MLRAFRRQRRPRPHEGAALDSQVQQTTMKAVYLIYDKHGDNDFRECNSGGFSSYVPAVPKKP